MKMEVERPWSLKSHTVHVNAKFCREAKEREDVERRSGLIWRGLFIVRSWIRRECSGNRW